MSRCTAEIGTPELFPALSNRTPESKHALWILYPSTHDSNFAWGGYRAKVVRSTPHECVISVLEAGTIEVMGEAEVKPTAPHWQPETQ